MHPEIGVDVRSEHVCSANPLREVAAVLMCRSACAESDYQWALLQWRVSTSLDVRSGESNAVGELLSSTLINIQYCPFCGERLLRENA